MTEKKQLSIFWDNNCLYCVESSSGDLVRIFNIPLQQEAENTLLEDSQIPSIIQKAIQENKISATDINLSLPTKDIIFRSFVIPWMQSSEIKEVVEFETSKYIPFALDELHYSFHSTIFTEEGTRRIRISLVAIKKITLKRYIDILEQSELEITTIEAEPLSLIRVLLQKEIIKQDQTIALIENNNLSGKIIIVNHGIPQFVREFQLKPSSQKEENIDPALLETQLLNEIRISLEYFNRQDSQLNVTKILVLSTSNSEKIPARITQELDIPSEAINIESILTNNKIHTNVDDTCYITAYGAGISNIVQLAENFYFHSDRSKTLEMNKSIGKKDFNVKAVAITAAACIVLIASIFVSSNKSLTNPKKRLTILRQELGTSENTSISLIKKRIENLKAKLDNYKTIRMEGETALFLELLPDTLPKGTWITNLTVDYPNTIDFSVKSSGKKKATSRRSSKRKSNFNTKDNEQPNIIINIEGYAYSENTNEAFGLINEILKRLKLDENFSRNFKKIILKTIKSSTIDGYPVTSFVIRCE